MESRVGARALPKHAILGGAGRQGGRARGHMCMLVGRAVLLGAVPPVGVAHLAAAARVRTRAGTVAGERIRRAEADEKGETEGRREGVQEAACARLPVPVPAGAGGKRGGGHHGEARGQR